MKHPIALMALAATLGLAACGRDDASSSNSSSLPQTGISGSSGTVNTPGTEAGSDATRSPSSSTTPGAGGVPGVPIEPSSAGSTGDSGSLGRPPPTGIFDGNSGGGALGYPGPGTNPSTPGTVTGTTPTAPAQ